MLALFRKLRDVRFVRPLMLEMSPDMLALFCKSRYVRFVRPLMLEILPDMLVSLKERFVRLVRALKLEMLLLCLHVPDNIVIGRVFIDSRLPLKKLADSSFKFEQYFKSSRFTINPIQLMLLTLYLSYIRRSTF